MTTDFETGLFSIQILSECCSGCGACYENQKASKMKKNDGEVRRTPFRSFLKFYARFQELEIHQPDRQKQHRNLGQPNSLPRTYSLSRQYGRFGYFGLVGSHDELCTSNTLINIFYIHDIERWKQRGMLLSAMVSRGRAAT